MQTREQRGINVIGSWRGSQLESAQLFKVGRSPKRIILPRRK